MSMFLCGRVQTRNYLTRDRQLASREQLRCEGTVDWAKYRDPGVL